MADELFLLTEGLVFVAIICIAFIALSWNWFLIGIRIKLFKHSIVEIVRKDGSIELTTKKNPEKIKIGKGIITDETDIVKKYHFEYSSGKPLHVVIQGLPENQNLLEFLEKKGLSRMESKLHSISNAIAYSTGYLEGTSQFEKKDMQLFLIIGLAIVAVLSIASIYLSMQNNNAIVESLATIKDLLQQLQPVVVEPG